MSRMWEPLSGPRPLGARARRRTQRELVPADKRFEAYVVLGCALIFLVTLVLGLLLAAPVSAQGVPLATARDEALALVSISLDGKRWTFRPVASDDVTVCVEPRPEAFGRRACFTLGEIRSGKVAVR